MRKKTIQDCRLLAKNNSGEFLSDKYIDAHTKYKWKCKNGHIFLMSYACVQSGQWCKKCYLETKWNIGMVKDCAKGNGGKCLSNIYTGQYAKYDFECVYGHIWSATYKSIRSGTWCPVCARMARRCITQDAIDLAQSNGGRFLSEKYITNSYKYTWQCEKGHIWNASYSDIRSGCWCPKCNSSRGIVQAKLADIISCVLFVDVQHNYRGFEWLRMDDSGRKQEIDIWVSKYKLAIEYDGEQHFHPMRYGTEKDMVKKLNRTILLDQNKNIKIFAHPDEVKYFVRFNYKENISTDYVVEKLTKIGVI